MVFLVFAKDMETEHFRHSPGGKSYSGEAPLSLPSGEILFSPAW